MPGLCLFLVMAAHLVAVPHLATRVTLSSLRAATAISSVASPTTFCTPLRIVLMMTIFPGVKARLAVKFSNWSINVGMDDDGGR